MKKFLFLICALCICLPVFGKTINWYVDSSVYNTSTCQTGGDLILPTAPTKRGYTFMGWVNYTPIEYLESTGTQYIDTGIVGKTGVSVEAKFMLASTVNASLFGCRESGNTRFWPAMWYSLDGELKWNATIGVDMPVGPGPQANTLYTTYFVSNSSGWTFYVNGERISRRIATVNNTNTVWMFGTNDGHSDPSVLQYPFYGKVYYAKIWEAGTLVRNFVPAKRNSDSAIGMYDTVSGQFFTNQGTGDFVAGPEI